MLLEIRRTKNNILAGTGQKCEAQKTMFETRTAQKRQEKQDTFQPFADFFLPVLLAFLLGIGRQGERGNLGHRAHRVTADIKHF